MKISTSFTWTMMIVVLLGIISSHVADAQSCCSTSQCGGGQFCNGACCSCHPSTAGTCVNAPAPVPSPTAKPTKAPDTDVTITCFSAPSATPVLDVGPVAMKDLRVGDKVAVASGKYEPVYAFAVREPEQETQFLQIFTNQKEHAPLEITPLHLVYKEGHAHPVQASTIKAGDVLYGEDDARLTVQKVKSVFRTDGAYAPLTASGKIMVDGIQASTYASLQKKMTLGEEYAELANGVLMPISQQTVIHMHLALYRMFCLGISSSFCDVNQDGTAKPFWVDGGIQLVALADAQSVAVQIVMGIIYLAAVVPFFVIEVMFGSKFAPLAMAMTVFAFLCMKKKNGGKEKTL